MGITCLLLQPFVFDHQPSNLLVDGSLSHASQLGFELFYIQLLAAAMFPLGGTVRGAFAFSSQFDQSVVRGARAPAHRLGTHGVDGVNDVDNVNGVDGGLSLMRCWVGRCSQVP